MDNPANHDPMSHLAMPPESAALSIAAVERETGLAKDTLRVWEKRYGFPAPLRDAAGDRIYPSAQVVQLKLIRRLLDAGMRPGKVVGLGHGALEALLATTAQRHWRPMQRRCAGRHRRLRRCWTPLQRTMRKRCATRCCKLSGAGAWRTSSPRW